jgi:hypothetical protein
MTCAKLLIIATDAQTRRRLLATWREFIIQQPRWGPEDATSGPPDDGPVAFTRLTIREGLALSVFVVDGGWRREYVCQALAQCVDGYCLVLGDRPTDLALGRDLLELIGRSAPGMVAVSTAAAVAPVCQLLSLPDAGAVPVVDCADRASVGGLVSEFLERLAASKAA